MQSIINGYTGFPRTSTPIQSVYECFSAPSSVIPFLHSPEKSPEPLDPLEAREALAKNPAVIPVFVSRLLVDSAMLAGRPEVLRVEILERIDIDLFLSLFKSFARLGPPVEGSCTVFVSKNT